jgi:hypothetical protein
MDAEALKLFAAFRFLADRSGVVFLMTEDNKTRTRIVATAAKKNLNEGTISTYIGF